MFPLPPSVRVFFAAEAVDLRKSFDGLSTLIEQTLGHDPLSGHLYVFRNKRANQVRVLFWDRTGYCIFGKKLARGTFKPSFAIRDDAREVEVDSAELSLMLEGLDLLEAKRRKRWRAPARVDERNLVCRDRAV